MGVEYPRVMVRDAIGEALDIGLGDMAGHRKAQAAPRHGQRWKNPRGDLKAVEHEGSAGETKFHF